MPRVLVSDFCSRINKQIKSRVPLQKASLGTEFSSEETLILHQGGSQPQLVTTGEIEIQQDHF